MPKAVALLSGGLDSILSIIIMIRQGIDVTAVKFFTPFDIKTREDERYVKNLYMNANKFGFELILKDLEDKFLEIVKKPKHGYGKNMNPCIDCRILMLREAKEFLVNHKADFIITGEVIGQRPMSQKIETLYHIDKEADLYGYVVRPLSAKLLKPTIPEDRGIINRETLYGFSGRSRKSQLMLAEEFGLYEFPSPAGGCLLTDPLYSLKLRDLLLHIQDFTIKDVKLLRVGRHFRYSDSCKIIVGRNEEENEYIEGHADPDDYILRVEGYASPLALVTGRVDDNVLNIASSICARYSDAKRLPIVEVKVEKKGLVRRIKVEPAEDEVIDRFRIDKMLKPNNYSLIS
jgi:tRNA-specific 2-thiouridylase